MVVLGTKEEYFNAVWVKNEWSRYLGLIKEGKKKVLIPAYKDMDPYDIPEEFSHLQAQDMSKLGFMQDLIRGIKKIVAVEEPKTVVREVAATGGAPVKNLLKRAQMFLADGDFESADEYCEKTLDQDPENGEAYMYKLFVRVRAKNKSTFEGCGEDYSAYPEYKKALRYGSEEQQSFLRVAHGKMQEKVDARNRENERRRRVSELVSSVNQNETLIANRVSDCKKAACRAGEGGNLQRKSKRQGAQRKNRRNHAFERFGCVFLLCRVVGFIRGDDVCALFFDCRGRYSCHGRGYDYHAEKLD